MTRRDFELIAQLIAASRSRFKSNTAHARYAGDVADALRWTNDRFDRSRFVMAAMPAAWVGTRHATAWERQARR
jgi:hypothetical protein